MGCQSSEEAKAIMRSLRRDPTGEGFTHLGTDGVLRTFDGARNVVDYRRLSHEEIASVLEIWPPQLRAEIGDTFIGVDCRDVTDEEQLLHPGPELIPT